MIREVFNYFTPPDGNYYGGHPHRRHRQVKWGRIGTWGYGIIAFFMFGHIYTNYPEMDSWNYECMHGDVKPSIATCGIDQPKTIFKSLAEAAAWPLAVSVKVSEELSK